MKPGRPYKWGDTEAEHMKLIRDVRKAWEDYLESIGKSRTAWRGSALAGRKGKYPTSWAAAGVLQKANPEYRSVTRKNLARILNRHFKRHSQKTVEI